MATSGALPRTGGNLFRPSSAPRLGPPGGPSAGLNHTEARQKREARRFSQSGTSSLVVLPKPELYKQQRGGYQGTTFGPPPGRKFKPRHTGLLEKAYGQGKSPFNHPLPNPAMYKKNTTVCRGSGIGMWSFGPGAGKHTPPRLRPSSASLLTQNAFLNHGYPDPVLYREPRRPGVIFAKPSSRPPSPTDSVMTAPPVVLSTTASAAELVRPRPRSAGPTTTPTRERPRMPTPQPASSSPVPMSSRGATPLPTASPDTALSLAATVPASPTPLQMGAMADEEAAKESCQLTQASA